MENQITVFELHNAMKQKEARQVEMFASVLDRCYARIRRCASVNRTDCMYDVPELIIGKPLYDVNKCVKYVKKHLEISGFIVEYVFPRFLLISWDLNRKRQMQPTDVRVNRMVPGNDLSGISGSGISGGPKDAAAVSQLSPGAFSTFSTSSTSSTRLDAVDSANALTRLRAQREAPILPIEGPPPPPPPHSYPAGPIFHPNTATSFRPISAFVPSPQFSLKPH